MATLQRSINIKLNLDEDGFLMQPEMWNKDIAQLLAQSEVQGTLTEDHWKIIDYLRKYYFKFETIPPFRILRKDTECDIRCIYRLFPSGLAKGACKVAGIPRAKCLMVSGSF